MCLQLHEGGPPDDQANGTEFVLDVYLWEDRHIISENFVFSGDLEKDLMKGWAVVNEEVVVAYKDAIELMEKLRSNR